MDDASMTFEEIGPFEIGDELEFERCDCNGESAIASGSLIPFT